MSATRPLQLTYLRPAESAKPASTAIVPVVDAAQWVPPAPRFPSPDPTFVTQLIANAEQLAERRRWPRDSAADARSAYTPPRRNTGAGLKTRQMI
ncbi:hypothetical protein [Bradyrhizobium sp. Tv2a-2]|uniref:hypothetical protein n=1 Tax=Bradyrhizobium sp. Tv2a-2 TaxID=113395 RepID=UPI001FD9C07F|nr:hypothetical protein [Bradyrhizobium sp. Tv2a-2]